MSDRVVRIILDPTGAEAGAARTVKALQSVGNAARAADRAMAGIGSDNDTSGKVGAAANATTKLASSTNAAASASRSRASAASDETAAQGRLNKTISDSVTAYEAQRKAAYAAYQARMQAEKASPPTAGSKSAFDSQNKTMGLSGTGKVAADVLNGTKDIGKVAGDVRKVEGAVEGLTSKLHLGAGAFREIIVLGREAGRGDFTRMAGSASILFQRLGGIEAVGVPLLATLGGIGIVVGVVAAAMAKGSEEATHFNNMLSLSGNYAGLTSSSYLAMAQSIGASTNTSIASNEGLITSLAKTNSFTKEEIGQLTESAQRLSRATGESADDIVADFTKMKDGPTAYARTFADMYGNVLSPKQIAHIKLLEDTGDKAGALKALIIDMNTGIAASTTENTGYIVRGWNSVTNAISDAWTKLKQFGAAEVPGQRVARLQSELANAQAFPMLNNQVPALKAQLAQAQAEQAQGERQAAAQAAHARTMREGNDAARELSSTYGSLIDSQTRYTNDVKKLRATVDAALKADPNNKDAQNINAHWGAATAKLRQQDMPAAVKADNKAAREAESAAKRQAREDQQHLEAGQKYLDSLSAQGKAAAEVPLEAAKTLAIESETEKLGERMAATAKGRAMIEQAGAAAQAKYVAKTLEDATKAADADARAFKRRQDILGLTDKQAAIQEAGDKERDDLTAKLADAQGNIAAAAQKEIDIQIQRARLLAAQTYDLEQQAQLLGQIGSLSEKAAQDDRLRSLRDQRVTLDQLNTPDATGQSALQKRYGADAGAVYKQAKEGLDDAVQATSDTFRLKFASAITDLGQQLGGELGKAVGGFGTALEGALRASEGDFSKSGAIGGIISAFQKNANGTKTGLGQSAQDGAKDMLDKAFSSDTWAKPFQSMSNSFNGLSDTFKSQGFAKGLGKALGQAGVGIQIGDTVNSVLAPLGKALGFKTSKTGSEIGGALGSIGGPVGSAVGSVVGGILGGLFKKSKYGTTAVQLSSYGTLAAGDARGNNGKAEAASTEGATSVASGLNSIAQSLGASITGTARVSIGQYKGKWRVSDIGRTGKLMGDYSDVKDFGTDGEADAVQYAIKTALKQGVLTGLSDFSEQLLRTASDLDAATALAAKYENVLKDLAAQENPVQSAFDTLKKSFTDLEQQMSANGATAADLANVEKDYDYQRKAALKDQLSDLQSLKDKLNGDGSGATGMDRLAAAQTAFRAFESQIDQGQTVNQSDFATAGGSLFDTASSVYGTSNPLFQSIRAEIGSYDDKLTSAITSIYGGSDNSDVVNAIQQQAATQDASYVVQQQMLQVLQAINSAQVSNGGGQVSTVRYVNGVAQQ